MEVRQESRLGPDDRGKYAYGEEWYSFSEVGLLKLPSKRLIPLEREMDFTVGELIVGIQRRSTEAMRAMMWLSRKLKHSDIEKFKDFDPIVWEVESRVVDEDGHVVEFNDDTDEFERVDAEGDADPLDPGPPVSSS